MYDPFAKGLIENLPDFDELIPDRARRALSQAYFTLIDLRLNKRHEMSDAEARDIVFLRRLANTLESRAVFDTNVDPDEQRASAFVAAEALSLLAGIRETLGASSSNPIRIEREEVFSRVEAALLYMLAGYDANAGGIVREIGAGAVEPVGNIYNRSHHNASEWTLGVLISFCRLHLNPLPPDVCPVEFASQTPSSLSDLTADVRGRLYARLGEAVRDHMAWLVGEVPEGLATARGKLTRIAVRLEETQHSINADIHHLARLLLAVLDNTQARSLTHRVSPPSSGGAQEYQGYLRARSKGPEGRPGRPLLWPSVQKYVEECLPGPSRHAVVSMPTGSGKSFLAELAASQALLGGWVLYLVPTNALAHQVRRDLKRDLRPLGAEVLAFIGHAEYTTLEEERVEHIPPRTIVVMTPEKCSLAMRLNPEVFKSCNLCVFDECHLIGEKSRRGVIAELVLSQLMVISPTCRFLLMSAMVQNPDRLAEWLQRATGGESLPVPLTWRPTRSLRSAVGVDSESANQEYNLAKIRLDAKSDRFKQEKYEPILALLAGLQGAWQTDDESDYALTKLPVKGLLSIHRDRTDHKWTYSVQPESWVNETSGRLGQMLGEAGIPTLIFLPASKHHSFSVAEKIDLSSELRAQLSKPSGRVRAFLTLAQDELGLPSQVGDLIERGLSIHTAGLLETEKFASEEAFHDQATMIMLATGTLAQGLNLPAIAVVIGGTRIGFPPQEPSSVTEQRKWSQLLNASGRAGRAGFANQGLVIVVPDSPRIFVTLEGALQVRDQLSFLGRPDAAIEVLSPLKTFMDSIAVGRFDTELASPDELVAAAMLVGGGREVPPAAEVLRRTYAAYLRQESGLDEGAESGAQRLAEVREDFVSRSGAPEWLPIVAQRAGLDFFSTLRLFQAWTRAVPQLSPDIFVWNTQAWLTVFFQTLEFLTPRQVVSTFATDITDLPVRLQQAIQMPGNSPDNPGWTPPQQWVIGWRQLETTVRLWMQGHSIKEIAVALLGIDPKDVSGRRNSGRYPIPKTLAFIGTIIDRLSMLAGGIVAIVEEELRARRLAGEHWPSQLPYELLTLPLALKYGCDSPQTLAWYRFGLRFRRPAHLLNLAFRLDPSIHDDKQMAETVRDLRSRWLRGEISVPRRLSQEYGAVFDAVETIIKAEAETETT